MSISFIGGASAASTSVTLPTHQTDDLILIFAYDQTSLAPSLPSGYTSITTLVSNGGLRLGYKIATSGSETSGTWTNADGVIAHIYRSDSGSLSIGSTPDTDSDFSTTIDFPSIVLDDADGSSFVVAFSGNQRNDTNPATPPTGMTNRTDIQVAGFDAGGHDTNAGVTTWAGASVSQSGSNGFWVSVVAEIVESASSVKPLLLINRSIANFQGVRQ